MSGNLKPATEFQAGYEKSADQWDQEFAAEALNAHHARACFRAFERVLGDGLGSSLAVELGIGTGLFTDRLAPRFERLVAVDFTQQMLDVLQPKLEARGIRNVDYVCAPAQAVTAVADASVDLAFCFGLLENVEDFGPLFREVRRMLKPGARFVGVVSNGASPWYVLRQKISGHKWYWQGVHLATEAELRDAALGAGLKVHTIAGWGLIPSQLPNTPLLAPVAAIESVLERTPLHRWMGGLSFRFDAPL
jgi:ubiquinone/menaquinone biosynthesis C-methylase UbiE